MRSVDDAQSSLFLSFFPTVLHSSRQTSADFVLYEVTNELNFFFKLLKKSI